MHRVSRSRKLQLGMATQLAQLAGAHALILCQAYPQISWVLLLHKPCERETGCQARNRGRVQGRLPREPGRRFPRSRHGMQWRRKALLWKLPNCSRSCVLTQMRRRRHLARY